MLAGFHDDEGVHLAEPLAAGDAQSYAFLQALVQDVAFDYADNVVRTAGLATRPRAHHQRQLLAPPRCLVVDAAPEVDKFVYR